MFICPECLEKNYLPASDSFFAIQSMGNCECCGFTKICRDIKSSDLQLKEITKYPLAAKTIYELRQKLLDRTINEILSLKVFSSEGKLIKEDPTPNLILETQEKYFVATSGVVQFGNSKYWSLKQDRKNVLTATRTLGAAKLVIDFQTL